MPPSELEDCMSIKRKDLDFLENEEDKKRVLDLLHGEVDELKDKIDELSNQLTEANKTAETEKTAREKAVSDFEALKEQTANEKTYAEKESAYKEALTGLGIKDKSVNLILKAARDDITKLELKDGKIDAKVIEALKTEYADYVPKAGTQGADVDNPPAGGQSKMTKAQILEIKDAGERQRAMAENHELFGF